MPAGKGAKAKPAANQNGTLNRIPPEENATVIYLVRHALTPTTGTELPGRRRGLHLSKAGAGQAGQLAVALGRLEFTAIYTSPLERARETAAPLAAAQRLKAIRCNDLTEFDAGEWTGRRLSSVSKSKRWRELRGTPGRMRLPGGESVPEALARSLRAVEMIAQENPVGRVAAFTHADTIKLTIAGLMGMPLDFYPRLRVDPASASVLRLVSDNVELLAMNVVFESNGMEARF